jgi:hypothetical protein
MLSFLKKFFGAKAAVSPCPEAPYKVESASQFPFPKAEEKPARAKKPAAKKPAAKKDRKEKAPK